MTRLVRRILIVALAAATVLSSQTEARQARRRDAQRPPAAELDVQGMTSEEIQKLYVGTWKDQGGRFWFSIDKLSGADVQSATFRMAHLRNGRIDGAHLVLDSAYHVVDSTLERCTLITREEFESAS